MTTPAPAPAKTPTKTPAKSTATLHVKADTSHAVADLEALALAYAHTAPKNGARTSEFALTVVTGAVDFLLIRFHATAHLRADDAVIASLVLSGASGLYTLARTWLKAQHVNATH